MVFLIGCNHYKAQTYPDCSELVDPLNRTQSEFKERLIKAIEEFDPTLIAEEHHPEILQKRNLRSIVFESV
jgi:hypothetical protein